MTAGELMARLKQDPEFLAAQARREVGRLASKAERSESEAAILEELNGLGVTIPTLDDLVRYYAPIPASVAEVLLRWVPRVQNETAQEQLVRALAASKDRFDGRPLIELFENTPSETLRWVIANTIAESRPLGVTDWLVSVVSDPSYGKAREMLTLAVARLVPKELATEVLTALLDELPGHVALAFAEIGDEGELELLRAKLNSARGWVKKEIKKAIRSIEERVRKGTSHG